MYVFCESFMRLEAKMAVETTSGNTDLCVYVLPLGQLPT